MIKLKQRYQQWGRTVKFSVLSALLFTSLTVHAAPLVLASKNFTEQHILSAITVQYLTAKGINVTPKTDLASTIIRNAMLNKQVDIVWEYTGTSLIVYNQIHEAMSTEETYNTVKKLDAKQGIVWLEPAKMNNTYAFAMQRTRAEKENISTLSQLVERITQIQKTDAKHNWMIAFDTEFVNRSDGLKPMQNAYQLNLERPQIRQMDPGLVYNAIRDGFVDAGLIYTTDGRVNGFDLKVLEDDKGYFPSYAVTPTVRAEVLNANPALAEALNTLSRLLDNDTISALNAKVDIEHQSAKRVATQFLKDNGLL
ncbi:glycine betaine ABC transporter substrate-binding protein [Jinshanibacter sp. LJY008]|uniref:Glycine betaine ABC transporter substrate-binding protein n=1 Tax=Limnobaculum eriocheiris TaxID=2897391 RepID=A0A9X1SMM0_9GAMM|nr:glycine betaine ABC transporter substrate-binding protein [Limnobaculum eriocheiris]MCD1127414.1 glycine betaine ABC transporter substrate-binding protein [Limnobaculum eriocheiris]